MVSSTTAYPLEHSISCATDEETRCKVQGVRQNGQSEWVGLCMHLSLHLSCRFDCTGKLLLCVCITLQDRRNSHNYWFFPGRRDENCLALDGYFTYLCLQCIVGIEKRKQGTICFATVHTTQPLSEGAQAAIENSQAGNRQPRSKNKLTVCKKQVRGPRDNCHLATPPNK